MSILVTRPSPDGEALVSRLRTQGKVAWSFPLIEFAPGNDLPQLPALFDTLQPDDMVFMVSRHAVQYAHAALQRAGRDWPASLRYFAIGRSTALALHQGGYDWGTLAYAVGFGGSMIWFGSSAGVALSNQFPEARSVGAWLRAGWHVVVAYVIGFFVLLVVMGWHPNH